MPEPLALAWAPFARQRAHSLHRAKPFDCVITTSPPESAHSVGRALQRRGAAWVADVRDAWTFEPLRPAFPTAAQRRLDERLERRTLGAADAVVCVSEPAASDLRERGIADPLLVRNGADPELLRGSRPGVGHRPPRPRAASRSSTPAASARPGVTRARLIDALSRLAAENPDDAAKLELVVAGPLTESERELLRPRRQPRAHPGGRLARARPGAGSAARGGLAPAPRASGAHAARELQALRIPQRGTADPGPRRRHGGRNASRRAWRRRRSRRATFARSPTRLARRRAASFPPAIPDARAEHAYPAVAERMEAAVEQAIERRRT